MKGEGKSFCGSDESMCEGCVERKGWNWGKDIVLVDFWSDTEALLIQPRHVLQQT